VDAKKEPAPAIDAMRGGGAPLPFFHKLVNLSRPHQLLQLIAKANCASHGAIGLVSAEGDLQEHVTFGMGDDVTLEPHRSTWNRELILCIVQQAVVVNVPDFSQDPLPRGMSLAPAAQPPLATGPFLGVPLICHGRCRGALYLARPPGQPPFSDQDLETLLPVCTWLEHGSFFEEARLLAQLRLLNQVAQAAAGSLDLSRILTVALRELDRHLPQYICAVWLLEEGERAALGDDEQSSAKAAGEALRFLVLSKHGIVASERATKLGLAPGLRLALDQTRFGVCLGTGRAQYVELGEPDRAEAKASVDRASTPDSGLSPFELQLRQRGATSSFAVPLRAGDQAVGILQGVCTRASGFTNEQIQLLYLVADLLGPAISNCQLFRRLRAAYEELRTAQTQLIQAEKMRALGELAGGMAHDFNNSLCGVLGFVELALADKSLDPTIAGYLELARTCSLDAAQTVRRVQDFARWQRHELSIQLLDFNELVNQTLEMTRHKWESLAHVRGTPITVQVEVEAKEWVSGSPAELREVLTNLIFNAVDAMPEGGHLSVRTWNTATDLYLSVSDTGVGMSDSTRRRLFEPFFTTKGERGNGLGLSVTFGIIQRYGGEITVDSEPGHGSTFMVRLPLKFSGREGPARSEKSPGACAAAKVPEIRSAENAANERSQPDPAPSPKRQGLRILVVEDEENIRRFLSQALTQLGHCPRTAADAEEGLAAFSAERFDLVFTDLGLPGVNGEELARTIARESPATPVVLLTGWSNQLKDEPQPPVGVTHILGKPITLSTLSSALAAVCQDRGEVVGW
jgi:signal transduction histidine kinase/CheY-like chemotaxis protein